MYVTPKIRCDCLMRTLFLSSLVVSCLIKIPQILQHSLSIFGEKDCNWNSSILSIWCHLPGTKNSTILYPLTTCFRLTTFLTMTPSSQPSLTCCHMSVCAIMLKLFPVCSPASVIICFLLHLHLYCFLPLTQIQQLWESECVFAKINCNVKTYF